MLSGVRLYDHIMYTHMKHVSTEGDEWCPMAMDLLCVLQGQTLLHSLEYIGCFQSLMLWFLQSQVLWDSVMTETKYVRITMSVYSWYWKHDEYASLSKRFVY